MATVSQYQPKTAAQMQQEQLIAAKLGLDLAHFQQFSQNPNAFKQQFADQFDPATNRFNIEGVTPGALIGAPQGPNGSVLAAGSTPTNPLDLKGVTSSAVKPGSVNFLPPYLQSGTPSETATPAIAPASPPIVPPVQTGVPMQINRTNAGIRAPLDFPQYLRNRKSNTNPVAYG